MIDKKDWPALVAGLRETLVEHGTAKTEAEKLSDPTSYEARKTQLKSDFAEKDALKLDPNMSDDEFWAVIALKPFYVGHKSKYVNPFTDYMRANYFSNWQDLCKPEWDVGGSKWEEFKVNKLCYRNMRDAGRVVYAARTIKRLKGFNNRSMMAHVLRQIADPNSRKGLEQAHNTLKSFFSFKEGAATAFHAMTELGFKVVKPDRFVNRIAVNMGLIESYKKGDTTYVLDYAISTETASTWSSKIEFCWALQDKFGNISNEANLSMRSLDYIFSKLGQEPDPDNGFARTICTEKAPLCNLCGAKPFCAQAKRK